MIHAHTHTHTHTNTCTHPHTHTHTHTHTQVTALLTERFGKPTFMEALTKYLALVQSARAKQCVLLL